MTGTVLVSGPRWFVIATKPGMERGVDRGVKTLNVGHLCPLHVRVVRHAGRDERVKRPLFPLYTFAQFDIADPNDPWPKILRIPGVVTILGMKRASRGLTETQLRSIDAQKPTPMRPGVIEHLQQLMDVNGGAIPLQKKAFQPLEKGTKVTIIEGPFSSFEGLVVEDARTRVKVLLDLFGRSTPLELHRDQIRLQH